MIHSLRSFQSLYFTLHLITQMIIKRHCVYVALVNDDNEKYRMAAQEHIVNIKKVEKQQPFQALVCYQSGYWFVS